jgi:two-component system sensor histidine kinase YesM
MKKIKTDSIYYRLLITFLLIILPIIALGAAIFQWGRSTIQTQTEQAAAENVSFLKSTLETEVSGVKLLQYSLSGDNTLLSLITQQGEIPPYDYYTNVASLQERLNIVKNSNNFIQSVRVYIPAAGRVVSSDSGYRTVGEKELTELLQMQTDSHFPLIFSSSGITADSVFPPTTSSGKQPLYLCEVVLSDSQLRGFLNKFENYSNSDTALYDYSSREWVFGQKSIHGMAADAGLQELVGSRESRNMRITLNGRDYFAAVAFSKYLNLSIVQYVPVEDVFRTPNVYRRLFILYLLLSAVIIYIYSRTTYRFVKYPINVILKAFHRLQQGDMGVRVQTRAASEFNDLYRGFNQTADRLNELIDRVYKQELYAKKAELKQLQAQINPHFLYNSYFMLSRMIREEDMESAGQLCSYLGTYFEYITRNANEEVPLWKEREHALSYAMIQQMRFSERLRVEVGEIPADWSELFRSTPAFAASGGERAEPRHEVRLRKRARADEFRRVGVRPEHYRGGQRRQPERQRYRRDPRKAGPSGRPGGNDRDGQCFPARGAALRAGQRPFRQPERARRPEGGDPHFAGGGTGNKKGAVKCIVF